MCVRSQVIRLGLRNPRKKERKKVRMPLSLRSIAGVPSSWALPGYPITAHHLCAFLI